jgi:Domain of unknown function (DUF4301)
MEKNNAQIPTQRLGLTPQNIAQLQERGISLENLENQINRFNLGVPCAKLIEPAGLLNGILKFSIIELNQKAVYFEYKKSNLKLQKFVPASGAASRMFKFLMAFLLEFDIEKETINSYINRNKDFELQLFILGLDKFPFFETIDKHLMQVYPDFKKLSRDYKNYYFIKMLLSDAFYDFANKPKGVLPFHHYGNHIATAIEEHLYESIYYASSNQKANLHFTISKTHQTLFETIVNEIRPRIEAETDIQIKVDYSYQKKETDSVAVDLNNTLFKDEQENLIFRPAGHGALIQNLNNIDADLIFIKNIDNLAHSQLKKTAFYKKALAGILIELQTQIFGFLHALMSKEIAEETLKAIITFCGNSLNIKFKASFFNQTTESKVLELKSLLNRPIRVCGMVINEGEPGGGPFWVQDENGMASLQIVESAEVNLEDDLQKAIFNSAGYFNPVDIVCGLKDYRNQKFDLTQFVNHNSGFIVTKTHAGKIVKSYELPGLWNGAMANWISVFVEMPIYTFNPVKTVNDLLKPLHQPQ